MCGLLTGQPCEDPTKSVFRIDEESPNGENDSFLVEYDRTVLFPLTRWIQTNTGNKITHEKLDEFETLMMEVQFNFNQSHDGEYTRNICTEMLFPVQWAMTHVWDLRGELRPWLATKMCKVIVGTMSPDILPMADSNATARAMRHNKGESMMMAMANIESSLFGEGETYTSEEIEEKRKDQEIISYDHNLEPYLNQQ